MVSIICCSMRQHFMENVFKNYENQKWVNKELIVILNRDDMDITEWKKRARLSHNVRVYQRSEKLPLGRCLNFGIRRARYDIIAKFDDDDYYGPNYLTRTMEAFKKTDADVIGKRTVFIYFEKDKILSIHKPNCEEKYDHRLKGATLVFKKKVFETVKFPNKNHGEDTVFTQQCKENNIKVYSTDKYNYVCVRSDVPGHHTWRVSNDLLLERSSFVCETDNYKPFIHY